MFGNGVGFRAYPDLKITNKRYVEKIFGVDEA
jgi:hypothetical protein